jgi:hypothetical protein
MCLPSRQTVRNTNGKHHNQSAFNARKPLRQAVHVGFLSLKSIRQVYNLMLYAFDRLRKHAGSFRVLILSSTTARTRMMEIDELIRIMSQLRIAIWFVWLGDTLNDWFEWQWHVWNVSGKTRMPGWRSCLLSTCDLNRDTISRAVTDRVTVISTVTDRDRMIGLDLHINTLDNSSTLLLPFSITELQFWECIALETKKQRRPIHCQPSRKLQR